MLSAGGSEIGSIVFQTFQVQQSPLGNSWPENIFGSQAPSVGGANLNQSGVDEGLVKGTIREVGVTLAMLYYR